MFQPLRLPFTDVATEPMRLNLWREVLAIVLLTVTMLLPRAALAQGIPWTQFQDTLAEKDLVGLTDEQALTKLVNAGHLCGVFEPAKITRNLTPQTAVWCIINNRDENAKCPTLEVFLGNVTLETGPRDEFLSKLEEKKVAGAISFCVIEVFAKNLVDTQAKGVAELQRSLEDIPGNNAVDAVRKLMSQGFLCGSVGGDQIKCIHPYNQNKFCLVPSAQLQLELDGTQRALEDSAENRYPASLKKWKVKAISSDCSIPWWLRDISEISR